MTHPHPQQYLITEDELHEYFQLAEEAYTYKYAADKRDEIRSRTHTPAAAALDKEARHCFGKHDDCPAQDECNIRIYCEKYEESLTMQGNIAWAVNEEHDAATRKAEREKMLEEICEPATDENKKDGWKLNVKWLVDIHRNIRNEGDNLCLEDIESVLLALKESLRGGAP